MTRTAESERLNRHRAEPYVEIHPQDAAVFGLANGEIAEISNRHGKAWLRVRIEPGQRRGSLFVPMHWSDQFAARARVDALVTANFDPHSGQPELKHASVSVRPLPSRWRGLLLTRERLSLSREHYWAGIPIANGWLYWLAGDECLRERERAAAGHDCPVRLRCSLSGRTKMNCATRGLNDDRLQAVMLLGEGDLVSDPWWLASRWAMCWIRTIGACCCRASPAANRPSRARWCAPAFRWRRTAIAAAIEGGCQTSAALGEKLRCGTNCGSCVPELNRLIRERARPPREAAKVV